jgi:hypothetical protein
MRGFCRILVEAGEWYEPLIVQHISWMTAMFSCSSCVSWMMSTRTSTAWSNSSSSTSPTRTASDRSGDARRRGQDARVLPDPRRGGRVVRAVHLLHALGQAVPKVEGDRDDVEFVDGRALLDEFDEIRRRAKTRTRCEGSAGSSSRRESGTSR